MQQVYRGRTESGIEGLFTGNTLALPLSRIGYKTFDSLTEQQKKEYCLQYEFEYVANPNAKD